MKGIKIEMPFLSQGNQHNEVDIISEKFRYSEVFNLVGIQVENEENKEEALKLCKQISKLVKELHELTK
jgi:hypothetical protein